MREKPDEETDVAVDGVAECEGDWLALDEIEPPDPFDPLIDA